MRLDKAVVGKRLLFDIRVSSAGCWEWQHRRNPEGYGLLHIAGRDYLVHRLAMWVWRDFDLASPLLVRHRCDNPPCCNPDHLIPGTQLDNMRDRDGRLLVSEETTALVIALDNDGMVLTDIMRQTRLSTAQIRGILRRARAGKPS
jgi:hypothetical protein